MDKSVAAETESWHEIAEKGSVLGIRFFVALVGLFGRTAARAFLAVLMIYYVAFARTARRHSRIYLNRVGQPTSLRNVYRHFLQFGRCALDRVFFIRGTSDGMRVQSHGRELLLAQKASGRGAILLGAHVGSFEAMRGHASSFDLPLSVVMHTQNARQINSVLESLNPQSRVRIIEVGDGGVDFVFRIRTLIEAGEFVAILSDRPGKEGSSIPVPFLGANAPFPTGPYQLAAALKCPVYVTLSLYRDDDHYDVYCERFADEVVVPRKDRETALREYASRYAEILEKYVRMAPYNWFNFYDFWAEHTP